MSDKTPPLGRPSKYDPAFCELLIDHMSKGYSFESFAGLVSATKKTLYTWTQEHPAFLHAKEEAFEKSRIFWEKLAIEHAVNVSESSKDGESTYSKSTSLNASAWIFNMKNRFGWRDKQPGEADVVVNNFAALTDEQLAHQMAEIEAKKAKAE